MEKNNLVPKKNQSHSNKCTYEICMPCVVCNLDTCNDCGWRCQNDPNCFAVFCNEHYLNSKECFHKKETGKKLKIEENEKIGFSLDQVEKYKKDINEKNWKCPCCTKINPILSNICSECWINKTLLK